METCGSAPQQWGKSVQASLLDTDISAGPNHQIYIVPTLKHTLILTGTRDALHSHVDY
jgi:hypothetical protein